MTQLNLLTEAEKRDQAIQQVTDGSTSEERAICMDALETVIERGRDFTSEDVIEAMGENYDHLREPRLLGAVMRQAARTNRIISTGMYRTGTRRHCAPVLVWRVNGATNNGN